VDTAEPQPITQADRDEINAGLKREGIKPINWEALRDSRLDGVSNDKIICPFHDDHDPSLQLYADGHYHCYVCGAHGDIEELPEIPPAPAPNNTDMLKRSIELWQATVSIRGTLAERYLTDTRKLDLAVLPDINTALRFHPRCPFDGNSHPC